VVVSAAAGTGVATALPSEATSRLVWHDLECGGYEADLALWRELAGAQPQRVLAHEPHEPADRSDTKIEDDPEHDGTDHREQQQPELRPQAVERSEKARPQVGQQREDRRSREPPRPAMMAGVERQGRDDGAEGCEHQPEAAVG